MAPINTGANRRSSGLVAEMALSGGHAAGAKSESYAQFRDHRAMKEARAFSWPALTIGYLAARRMSEGLKNR